MCLNGIAARGTHAAQYLNLHEKVVFAKSKSFRNSDMSKRDLSSNIYLVLQTLISDCECCSQVRTRDDHRLFIQYL